MSVWETTNQAFAENAKAAFGFSTRTGSLTDTSFNGPKLSSGTAGTIAAVADSMSQPTLGGPPGLYNTADSGPLGAVIRDDKVWVCPSALARFYGGEIQNVPDDYLDTVGSGVSPSAHAGTAIGMGGRYLFVVAGRGNATAGVSPICNGGFPNGWIAGGNAGSSGALNNASPTPQTPFKLAICGCYGTFGPSTALTVPGTAATNQGGPVGPDGSSLNRHSSRW